MHPLDLYWRLLVSLPFFRFLIHPQLLAVELVSDWFGVACPSSGPFWRPVGGDGNAGFGDALDGGSSRLDCPAGWGPQRDRLGMDCGSAGGHDSGGLAGLPGRERIIFPALWQKVLPKPLLGLETERRSATIKTGCRLRGLCLAMAWNPSNFYLSSLLPGAGVATLAELFRTALGFTIWSFAGLLLLPTLSRYVVYEMDKVARLRGMAEEEFALPGLSEPRCSLQCRPELWVMLPVD